MAVSLLYTYNVYPCLCILVGAQVVYPSFLLFPKIHILPSFQHSKTLPCKRGSSLSECYDLPSISKFILFTFSVYRRCGAIDFLTGSNTNMKEGLERLSQRM